MKVMLALLIQLSMCSAVFANDPRAFSTDVTLAPVDKIETLDTGAGTYQVSVTYRLHCGTLYRGLIQQSILPFAGSKQNILVGVAVHLDHECEAADQVLVEKFFVDKIVGATEFHVLRGQ